MIPNSIVMRMKGVVFGKCSSGLAHGLGKMTMLMKKATVKSAMMLKAGVADRTNRGGEG